MNIDRYLALIQLDPAAMTNVRLTGSRWALVVVVADILRGRPAATPIRPERLVQIAAGLRPMFQFDWASYDTDPRGAFAADLSSFLNEKNILGSPSAFVPFLVELEALVRNPSLANDDTLTRLGAYTVALLCAASIKPEILPAAAPVLSDVVRVFARIGAAAETVSALRDRVHALASDLISRGAGLTPAFIIGHPELLEAEYEAIVYEAELRDLTDPKLRAAISQDVLSFLDDVFGPAIKRRADLVNSNPKGMDLSAVAQADLAHQHRTLTWRAALATARGQWTPDTVDHWRELAKQYESINDGINAAGAISAAIDRCGDAIESRQDQASVFAPSLLALADELDGRLAMVPGLPDEDKLDLLERCIRARLLASEIEQGTRSLQAALDTLAETRRGADTFRDAYLLRKADNYLGFGLVLDMLAAGHPDQRLDSAHRSILGRTLPPPKAIDNASVLRAHVYRTATVLGTITETNEDWSQIESAHELARSLDLAFTQCLNDVALWNNTGRVADTKAQWSALLERLLGQANLSAILTRASSVHRRLRIEVDGHGLHLPWAGLAVAADPQLEAVLMQRPSTTGATPLVPDVQPVMVLNGFVASDPLHNVIRAYAAALGGDHRQVASVADFRNALNTASRLIVLGCHGGQDAARGELRLSIGNTSVLALELFDALRLPRASTVFCHTCFAGGGQLDANGEWSSLPALFLRSGARVVVANRFPVWPDPSAGGAMTALLVDLATTASAADVWETARATTQWTAAQVAEGASPRTWLGWGTWTDQSWIEASAMLR